jgi:phenylacetate-CoA ligase
MGRILTQKVFIPLSHLRRRRAAGRPIYEAYKAGLEFRRESRDWSEERKRVWILNALRSLVRRAFNETDYYRELFNRIGFDANSDFGFEDFSRLPILEREDILQAQEKLISEKIPREQLLKDATGGSTGQPTEIWLGPEERGWKESGIDFSFEKIGVPLGAKTAYFWGHHLDPRGADNWRERLRAFAANVRYFDCFRLSPEIFRKYHAEFEKWTPDCIVAYANALGQFAEFLKDNNIEPKNYPRICFVTGAEKLSAEHRKTIEEVFGKPVYERYGGRDFGGIGIQTNPLKNLDFEIDWAWALVEPETEEENSPILVTKLHADGMPMLRYRTGDVGKFPAGSKSGSPAFYLREVIGREVERIWLPDGRWISGVQLPHLLKSIGVREFMFVQEEDYSVELQIVPKSDFGEAEKREILQTISANLAGVKVDLKVVDKVSRTEANKLRPVLSKINREKREKS